MLNNSNIIERLNNGLRMSYERLLHRKAALGQDMVFANEDGTPCVVPARLALEEYLKRKMRND